MRVLSVLLSAAAVNGCTNILVSKGASSDGSTHIAYNADSGSLFGSLGHYPAADHADGAMRDVWDWDGSFFLGQIPEVKHTYNVVGNMNEFGLVIGETTFGGLPELDGHGSGAIMDYGSLIWVTLQRAKTADEAITTIDFLLQTYGYASDGESFSIADGHSAWIMEIVGKGKDKGAVWVASRVPDGMVCSHANQARTRTFDHNDSANVRYAKDVVSFAQEKGLYPKNADAQAFSFSDVYDPVSFGGARLAEARVWNIFQSITDGGMDQWLDYAQGYNLTNRMPLFVKVPDGGKLTVNDTMFHMRTHFEGTWFDNRGDERADVGAQSGGSAYRWRPLVWKFKGNSYVNERTVGVQQTAWTFVGQTRSWLPAPVSGLFWFAPDDSSTAVRTPLYGSITKVPAAYAGRQGQEPAAAVDYAVEADAYNMNMDHAFWVYNLVANAAYGERYRDTYPLIQTKINELQGKMIKETAALDIEAAALYSKDPAAAVAMLTNYSVTTGNELVVTWRTFWMFLFSRFRDGFTTTLTDAKVCGPGEKKDCTSRLMPDCAETGYPENWYARIVADSDNAKHYGVPAKLTAYDRYKMMRMDKKRDARKIPAH